MQMISRRKWSWKSGLSSECGRRSSGCGAVGIHLELFERRRCLIAVMARPLRQCPEEGGGKEGLILFEVYSSSWLPVG